MFRKMTTKEFGKNLQALTKPFYQVKRAEKACTNCSKTLAQQLVLIFTNAFLHYNEGDVSVIGPFSCV